MYTEKLDRIIGMLNDAMPNTEFDLMIDQRTFDELIHTNAPMSMLVRGTHIKGQYRGVNFELNPLTSGVWIQLKKE